MLGYYFASVELNIVFCDLLIKKKIKTDRFFIPEKRMRPVGAFSFDLCVCEQTEREKRSRKYK